MADISCDTVNGTVAYLDGSSLDYDAAGNYCLSISDEGADSDIRPVYEPGDDGGGSQNFGLRSCVVIMKLCYVAASEEACIQGFKTDMIDLASGVFSMAVNSSINYEACIKGKSKAEQPKSTGLSNHLFRMDANLAVMDIRPS